MKKPLELFKLDGNIALVTGGLGNLGPYWIKALKGGGAKVVSIDLPNIKSSDYYFSVDITDINRLHKLHTQISKDLGSVTILVNNAGIDAPPSKHLEGGRLALSAVEGDSFEVKETGYDSPEVNRLYKNMWDVNVQGLVNCIEVFSPDMKKQKKGSIINIGSLYGEKSPDERLYSHLGFDKPWAYGATKAAVLQVTRHYSTRLAKYNIRVNTLSPGGVFNNQDKEFVKKYSQHVPLGRMAEKVTDLAGPLLFLASDASIYVTGINLQVNGGYTAW